MFGKFKSPNIDRLAEVDQADCEYDEKCKIIQGVVSPVGAGGWPRSNDYQVHCFSFAAWREIDGTAKEEMIEQKLTILRPVPLGKIPFDDFPEYTLHRIKALLSKDRTRAIFAGAEKLDSPDAELLAFTEELQKPVIVSTERFGELTLNRRIDWFEGNADWNGRPIEISFDVSDQSQLPEALKTAEALWDAQVDWKRRVDEYAVHKLLRLKNDSWLDEDESPLTPEQFKSRMRLQSISVHTDGSFDFWHDDGSLFWGHSIQISGTLGRGLTDADIPG